MSPSRSLGAVLYELCTLQHAFQGQVSAGKGEGGRVEGEVGGRWWNRREKGGRKWWGKGKVYGGRRG